MNADHCRWGEGGTCAFCECKQRGDSSSYTNNWPDHVARLWTDVWFLHPALLLSHTQVIPNSLYLLFPSLFPLAGSRGPRWKRWYPRPAWTAWTSRPPWTPRPRWSKLFFLHTASGWVCLSYVLVFVKREKKKKKKTGREVRTGCVKLPVWGQWVKGWRAYCITEGGQRFSRGLF